MSEVDRWLDERWDRVPEPFRGHLRTPEADDGESVSGALLDRGLDALSRARARRGRHRPSAFRLLAADAYLTWACEAGAGADDPEEVFLRILERVGAESR